LQKKAKFSIYIVLIIYSLVLLIPIIWMFITAFKTQTELFTNKLGLPNVWHISNFSDAWELADLSCGFINSITVVVVVFFLGIGSASCVSFILARFNFKGNNFLYLYFIAGMMVPIHAVTIPIYDMAIRIGATNNLLYLGLIYCGFYLPISILILTGFMSQIPKELEESAIIDGCNVWMIFTRIILPISREGLISVTVLTALYAWNDLLLPLILINRSEVITISLSLRAFFAEHSMAPTLLLAASFISMLPVLILYTVLQEKMIKGLTAGAVKG
jgi:raffinose/stachyose/melibiose transport system permease protein